MKEIDKLEAQVSQIATICQTNHLISDRLKFLAYYRHSLRLPKGRRANADEIQWCIDNCSGYFSQDHTCSPFAFSFAEKSDMLLFKLTFGVGKPKYV